MATVEAVSSSTEHLIIVVVFGKVVIGFQSERFLWSVIVPIDLRDDQRSSPSGTSSSRYRFKGNRHIKEKVTHRERRGIDEKEVEISGEETSWKNSRLIPKHVVLTPYFPGGNITKCGVFLYMFQVEWWRITLFSMLPLACIQPLCLTPMSHPVSTLFARTEIQKESTPPPLQRPRGTEWDEVPRQLSVDL